MVNADYKRMRMLFETMWDHNEWKAIAKKIRRLWLAARSKYGRFIIWKWTSWVVIHLLNFVGNFFVPPFFRFSFCLHSFGDHFSRIRRNSHCSCDTYMSLSSLLAHPSRAASSAVCLPVLFFVLFVLCCVSRRLLPLHRNLSLSTREKCICVSNVIIFYKMQFALNDRRPHLLTRRIAHCLLPIASGHTLAHTRCVAFASSERQSFRHVVFSPSLERLISFRLRLFVAQQNVL